MKKILTVLLLLLFAGSAAAQNTGITPAPQKVSLNKKQFNIEKISHISLVGEENGKLELSAAKILSSLKDNFAIEPEVNEQTGGQIVLKLNEGFDGSDAVPSGAMEEAYSLSIDGDLIRIEAASPKGIFYGAMSLVQLLDKADNSILRGMSITDWPDLPVRGISDDLSRGQVSTVENFRKIIGFIARHKMNTYMPYLEDMIKFEEFPKIGEGRGALTEEEINQILACADSNFVEVVPVFQTLGHYENILLIEDYLKYAEFPGAASLNVSSEDTYVFLEKMLEKVFELFPSKYFHMGADESYDVGLGASRHLVEKSDIADVHAKHYKKVYDIAKKHNKTVLMYGDIILSHPEILEQLPKDIIIVDWHYRGAADYPSTKTFNEAGHKYYVSPSAWNFLTTFPTNVNAIPNIKYITKAGLENGASGMINSNWGDYGAETIKELILFDYAWSAQCAWTYEKSDMGAFSKDFFSDFFGTDNPEYARIYKTLSNPLNQMMWHEIWRHPLLEFRDPVWWGPDRNFSPVGKIEWIEWTMPQTVENINKMKETALKNRDHFNILGWITDLNNWYVLKLKTSMALHDMMEGKNVNKQEVLQNIEKNIAEIDKLKKNFRMIWLNYYKEANLHMIMDKFDRLTSYYNETAEKIRNNSDLKKPLLESEWIYAPDSSGNTTFKKEFTFTDKPDSLPVQLMGDTYAKLYVNGEYVDQVYARRSLSLLVDYGRIKIIDLAPYLKEGENTIEVKVENYNRRGRAGFNLYGEMPDGEKILTGTSWQAKTEGSEEWKQAVVRDYPYIVTEPNFQTGRSSWIER